MCVCAHNVKIMYSLPIFVFSSCLRTSSHKTSLVPSQFLLAHDSRTVLNVIYMCVCARVCARACVCVCVCNPPVDVLYLYHSYEY